MKATDISIGVLNPIRDNCGISRFGASHGYAIRFALGHHDSQTGYVSPAKKPGLAPKRLICAMSMDASTIDPKTVDLSVKNPNGGEEVAHRSPQEIMDEHE